MRRVLRWACWTGLTAIVLAVVISLVSFLGQSRAIAAPGAPISTKGCTMSPSFCSMYGNPGTGNTPSAGPGGQESAGDGRSGGLRFGCH